MTSGSERRDGGSALVEAMVAVAVIAMMLAVTYRAVGASVLNARAAEASRIAALIAQSRLALVGAEIPLSPGETTGVDGDFAWQVRIEPEPAEPSIAGPLLSVTASARRRTDPVDRAVLRTWRLGPAG
jgi:hypothetical protein